MSRFYGSLCVIKFAFHFNVTASKTEIKMFYSLKVRAQLPVSYVVAVMICEPWLTYRHTDSFWQTISSDSWAKLIAVESDLSQL